MALEGAALTPWKKWQHEHGKEFFILGPLLPVGIDTGLESSENDSVIEDFLEKTLREHGEHSMIYVS